MNKRFKLTFEDGSEELMNLGSWKNLAVFLTRWEDTPRCTRPLRVTKVEVITPCETCGKLP